MTISPLLTFFLLFIILGNLRAMPKEPASLVDSINEVGMYMHEGPGIDASSEVYCVLVVCLIVFASGAEFLYVVPVDPEIDHRVKRA